MALGDVLSGLFGGGGKKSPSVLGIDIGGSSIKVVQLRKEKGVAVLETYGELALGPYAGSTVGQATNLPAEKIGETIRDLLRESKVTTTSCGVSIPFSKSLLTTVTLPRRPQKELETMIPLEARKHVPVPLSEVQLDWFVLPNPPTISNGKEEESRMVKVLLVAVHNDELKFLEKAIATAGLTASFYEIEIFSSIRASVDEMIKPVFVIDIGAAATKTYVVEHGVVEISHNIPRGGQEMTQTIAKGDGHSLEQAEHLKKTHGLSDASADKYSQKSLELVVSTVFSEAKRVMIEYETTHQKNISKIILTGGGSATKNLLPYAQNFFNIDVMIADPFGKVRAPAFMRTVLQEIGPEFAVACGLALRKLEEQG